MKICCRCKIEKDESEFSKKTVNHDGLKSDCKACHRDYYIKHKDLELKRKKKYFQDNKDKKREYQRQYREKNKDKKNLYQTQYETNRYKNDINYKLGKILRSRIRQAIKNNWKSGSAVKDLGCSINFLKSYIQSLFLPSMTWDNWSPTGWHIDHILPLDSFDLSDPIQLKQACHYTNLQPLWAEDNLFKSNKVV